MTDLIKPFWIQTNISIKRIPPFEQAVDRGNGAAAIWCQPIYWEMAMNAYKLAKSEKDKRRTKEMKKLCEKIFLLETKHIMHILILMIIMKTQVGSFMMI